MDGVLKLYVCGHTARSENAISSLGRICQEQLQGNYRLDVIDILEDPAVATHEQILATPTVVRALSHQTPRRLIGDFSDPRAVLNGLQLTDALALKDELSMSELPGSSSP